MLGGGHIHHVCCVLLLAVMLGAAATTATGPGSRTAPADTVIDTELLVVAGNPAGIGAAVAAARLGVKVQLMERLTMIGGMGAAGGVGLMNQGCGLGGVTGLGYEWGMLNGRYYNPTEPRLNVFPDLFVAAASFHQLLDAEPNIAYRLGCRFVSVDKDPATAALQSAQFLCSNDTERVEVRFSHVVDASYDGNVMVAANVTHAHGRESRSEFNESLAGVQLVDQGESFDKSNLTVDATFANGTLLPYISPEPLAAVGTADDRLMAFEFFACLSTEPTRIPYPRPPNYNPDDFALLLRQIEGMVANGRYPAGPPLGFWGSLIRYTSNQTKVLVCCGEGPVDSDQPDLNAGWATANHTERQRMEAAHRYYLLGSLYFMAHDPRVPNFTRTDTQRWGLCGDEYVDNGFVPPQLYIRISNRMRGVKLLTQNNIANPRIKPSSVSMGCWEFDQHTESRHAVPDPRNASRHIAINEGYFRINLEPPFLSYSHPSRPCAGSGTANSPNWYDVPFEVMLPKPGEASNLLVPVAISATSVAYASTRIEGMFMDLGTAAGVAVALARRSALPTLQQTNVTAVQSILFNTFKQRIHGPPGSPPVPPGPPPPPGFPAYYNVSQAGSAAWNGHYVLQQVDRDGRGIVYVWSGPDCPFGQPCALYAYDGQWRLGAEGKEIFYVAKATSELPPLAASAWAVANGTAPAPSLVAGPLLF